jgi:tRNA A37 N6-isopentenylltransferase MiaA
MGNYAIDDHTGMYASLALCAAAIETKLEAIDDSKVIRLLEVFQVGNQWAYCLIIDATA